MDLCGKGIQKKNGFLKIQYGSNEIIRKELIVKNKSKYFRILNEKEVNIIGKEYR